MFSVNRKRPFEGVSPLKHFRQLPQNEKNQPFLLTIQRIQKPVCRLRCIFGSMDVTLRAESATRSYQDFGIGMENRPWEHLAGTRDSGGICEALGLLQGG